MLLYSNKNLEEIIFKQELDTLSREHNFPLVHILTEQEGYEGEVGRIDQEKIARLVPDIVEREIYLCGPVGFMNACVAILKDLKVPQDAIHYEKFSLH